MQEEIWKDIPDYEGLYQVSNLGRVKALAKKWTSLWGYVKSCDERIMSQSISHAGYYKLNLVKSGIVKTRTVHQLVAQAFLNHTPNKYKLVVDHINKDKIDNRVENLRLVTQRMNSSNTHVKSSSKYVGVSWNKRLKKWQSQIQINGNKKHLGVFKCETKAHLVYQKEVKTVNQEFN